MCKDINEAIYDYSFYRWKEIDEPTVTDKVLDPEGHDPVLLYELGGYDIFPHAMVKAIKRFEDNETDRIIGEYEFVPHEDDTTMAKSDDGFELVDDDMGQLTLDILHSWIESI